MKLASMKISLAMAALLLAGPIAHAAISDSSIVFDGRADYLTQWYNDDTNSRPTNSTWSFPSVRADFKGKIGDETKYRMRLNFKKSGSTTNDNDNLSQFVDFFYAERTVAENLSLIVGKQNNQSGGWVRVYDPADVYFYPTAVQELINRDLFYTTGASLNYEAGGQFFNINFMAPNQVTNPVSASTNADRGSTNTGAATPNQQGADNARPMVGFRWFGKFLDDSIQPTLGYMYGGRQLQTDATGLANGTRKEQDSYASAGLKWTIPMVDVEADYLMNTYKNQSSDGNDDKTNTFYVLARYKFADIGLKPFITYENSTQKLEQSTEVNNKINVYEVGVEWYPKKDENFRYHIVYSNSNVKNDTTGIALKQQQIIAGMRFKADLLK